MARRDLLSTYRFDANQAVTGRYHATKKGIGFVQPEEDPEGEDMYIAAEDTLGAMDGDLVSVKVVPEGFAMRNVVTEVLEHRHTSLVGVVTLRNKKMFVEPINTKLPDVKIGKKHEKDAAPDDLVVVQLLSYGDGTTAPSGTIEENLGNKDLPGVDITGIVRELGIPTEFTEEETAEAETLTRRYGENADAAGESSPEAGNSSEQTVTIQKTGEKKPCENVPSASGEKNTEWEEGKREDLRSLLTVSVDEPGTEDMDDAVSLERKGDQWELGVHIADASWYVREGAALDKLARERGTSVYLPDRVIPMLPETLSTGLCSLRAGEDKRAMSVLMTMNDEGRVENVRIVPSLIRAAANLSYPEAQAILDTSEAAAGRNAADGTAGTDRSTDKNAETDVTAQKNMTAKNALPGDKAEEISAMLRDMRNLAEKMSGRRRERGEIAFDLPDVRIILDEKGLPTSLKVTHENEAQKMVSSFMVAANEEVAAFMKEHDIPGVFRVHERPEEEDAAAWKNLVQPLTGFDKEESELSSKDVQDVLNQAKGTPDENFVTLATLRMMSHAHYDPECRGHFGLAAKSYCHFTSPIRRYPDLMVHRLLHEYLDGSLTEERKERVREDVPALCEQCSDREHRSISCERTAVRFKMAQYLGMHLQEEADGVISRVTKNGFFVELPDTCEGFVSIQSIGDDYYNFEEEACRIVGKKTGRTFRLGDTVHIRVVSADPMERAVDFELA